MENDKALIQKDDSLPFKLMDALDDQLIIAELEGRMPEILTYHFIDKGQEVWGLSKAGVDEATGELARQGEVIRELELNFTDGEKEAFFNVKAGRYAIAKNGQEVLLDTKFGTKRQPKKTLKGNDNSFWYEQGSIKACRNASMRLIPKTIVQAVIENAKKKGKVKEIKKEEVGKTLVESDLDWAGYLKKVTQAKEFLGEDVYYQILLLFKANHANEIKTLKGIKEVYERMVQEFHKIEKEREQPK